MTPIEHIEQLSAEVANLRAQLTDTEGKLTAASANVERITELEAEVAKHGEAVASKDGEIAALVKERDEFKARAEKAEGAMALKPEAFAHITEGAKSVADGAAPAEKSLLEKLSELTARGEHVAARELYKKHKSEFKKLGATSPR